MTCGDCRHFFSSERANQRSVMAGFGYCHATDEALSRARFFRGDFTTCWQQPPRFAPGEMAP